MRTLGLVLAIQVLFSVPQSAQTISWAKQIGGDILELGLSVAVDANGNVFTTGNFGGTVDFDPGPDTFLLSAVGNQDVYIQKLNNAGDFIWAKQIGGADYDYGEGICLDLSGNVFVTGSFEGTADFDPGPDSFILEATADQDMFVLKLDSSGNLLWAKDTDGNGLLANAGIATDDLGNVYTTGGFSDTVDFKPGLDSLILTSAGSLDIFIQKHDANGNIIWVRQIGGSRHDSGSALDVDAMGNVCLTGSFQDTVDFNPGMPDYQLVANGNWHDIFILKLDQNGDFIWAKKMGSPEIDGGGSITVDVFGNVYTTGNFSGTADFDPGSGVYELSSAGIRDVFIQKLTASGDFVWAARLGGNSLDIGYSVAVDSAGYVYTTGSFQNTADFDPGGATYNLTSNGQRDVFIQKMTPSGTFIWAVQIGGLGLDAGYSLTVDKTGSIYATGTFDFYCRFWFGYGGV